MCDCGRRAPVKFPDIRAITEAMKFLAEQGIGKPAAAPTKPDKPRLAGSITKATDQELEALLDPDTAPDTASNSA